MRLIEEFGQRKYEEGRTKGRTEGFEEGCDKKSWEVAERLLSDDMPINKVSQMTDLPINQLELFNNGGK